MLKLKNKVQFNNIETSRHIMEIIIDIIINKCIQITLKKSSVVYYI